MRDGQADLAAPTESAPTKVHGGQRIDRSADQVTLRQGAVEVGQMRSGCLVVDSLGDDVKGEITPHFYHRSNNHRVVRARGHVADKGHVDLDLLNWQPL